MAVVFGSGNLGKIVSQNGKQIQLEWEDLLWASRALIGEGGVNISDEEALATLWTWASRMFLPAFARSSNFRKYKDMVTKHSQPVNPKWRRDGEFCKPGGRFHGNPNFCNERQLRKRERLKDKTWDQIPSSLQDLVVQWSRGQKPNPVPKSIDFAAERIGPPGGQAEVIWQTHNKQTFYTNRTSRAWSDDFIRIEFNGIVSEDSPSPLVTSTEFVGPPLPDRENRLFERSSAMTQGRNFPPEDQKFSYVIVSDDDELIDPHALEANRVTSADSRYRQPFERFTDQVNKTKTLHGSMDISRLVPFVEIKAPDLAEDSQTLVNLTSEIFSKSPIKNFEDEPDSIFRDRPIASVESFKVSLQPPDTGGASTILIGNLIIKVQNPDLIKEEHPKGRFLSYMLRQGYPLTIRFGWEGPREILEAGGLEWTERDFFIAQHSLQVNIDKTIEMNLKILPALYKVFQQMFIGESLPADVLTSQDQTEIIQEVIDINASDKQKRDSIAGLRETFNFINQTQRQSLREVEVGTDANDVTFGSILHGALENSSMIQPGIRAIGIENYIDGLKTIQSKFLSKKFQEIIEQTSYLLKEERRGTETVVVNIGPLFSKLVLPEAQAAVSRIIRNSPKVGTFDISNSTFNIPKRNNIRMVFDVFNRFAGQYANKPISIFPLAVDEVFKNMREQRTVGHFAGTVNNFITNVNKYISQEENYFVESDDNRENRLETPMVRYEIFEDPNDETSWVMYFYDSKTHELTISEALGTLNTADPEEGVYISYDDAKAIIEQYNIPWIEMAESTNLIKSMSARNTGDDLIQSRNMVLANSNRGEREITNLPPGISREFAAGRQNLSDVIGVHTLIIPLKVDFEYMFLSKALLFAPIYIYFPVAEFSGIFLPQKIDHEISHGSATTRFSCFIQTTKSNRIPRK